MDDGHGHLMVEASLSGPSSVARYQGAVQGQTGPGSLLGSLYSCIYVEPFMAQCLGTWLTLLNPRLTRDVESQVG